MGARCAKRLGMSLLEVAIVLALLVMLAGILVPTVGPRLDRRAGAEARSRLQIAVVRAQSQASAAGRAFRVLALSDDPQRLVAELIPMPPGDDTFDDDDTDPARTALGELPVGCRVLAHTTGEDTDAPARAESGDDGRDDDEDVLIGWVLPDGTFEPNGSCRLETRTGTFALTFDAWTGSIESSRVVADGNRRAGEGSG